MRIVFGSAVAAAVLAAGAASGQGADGAVVSPDGLREVWAPAGCHCVWGATRASVSSDWSAPQKLFEIRGAVGRIVFSPDGRRIAFENPRGDWTVEAPRSNPAMQGFSPARYYGWGYIATYDFANHRMGFVDPEFATDSDPKWESAAAISFTRHAEGAKDARLTRPAPDAADAPIAPGSAAAYFATPLPYQPITSADGTLAAYVTRAATKRGVWLIDLKGDVRPFAVFDGDDGQALSEVALAPHADAIAFVRGAAENKVGEVPNPRSLGEKPVRELWLGTPKQPPRKVAEGEAPQFTPDGTRLVWEGERGLMIAPVFRDADGGVRLGAASVLMADPMRGPRFSPDGSKLVFGREGALFVYDLANDRITPIEKPKGASDFAPNWSPDGTRLVFVRSHQPRDAAYGLGFDGPFVADKPWSIELYDVAANAVRDVWHAKAGTGSAFYQLDEDQTDAGRVGDQLYWVSGDRIVFPWEADGWRHLYAVPVAGGDAQLLTSGDGEIESVAQALDGNLIATTNIGDLGRRHLALIDPKTPGMAPITSGKFNQWGAAAMAGGAIAYVEAGWASAPQIHVRAAGGATIGSSEPDLVLPNVAYVEPKLIELTASDGATAYGQLFVPAHPNGCGVVFAHGGIKRQMLPGFHYMDAYSVLYETNQYLASKGCVVLSVEYRSSIMRGYAFRNAEGWGSAGASEMIDVAAAGTWLKTHPELKVKHVGVYGLSWGGYITAQALARYPDIFEAGFDMAGVHEFFGDRIPNSPEAKIADLKAPIYLIQGDDDRNVDFYQGLSLAKLLREHGTEVTLRAVPDEVHDMTSTFANLTDVYGSGADFLLDRLAPRKRR
jgi:dipeptidyl aminopeptidase/acylaminoacyl peptidase